jgi:hypothetical protein
VFFYRKGRRGFAEDARASPPLRKVVGGCGSRPAAGALRKGREALAPFALQKHRNAVKKHANFFHTIPSRTIKKIPLSHHAKRALKKIPLSHYAKRALKKIYPFHIM